MLKGEMKLKSGVFDGTKRILKQTKKQNHWTIASFSSFTNQCLSNSRIKKALNCTIWYLF